MSEIRLIVERFEDNGKQTLSHVHIMENNISLFQFAGMELPWKENEKMISCIPIGVYGCEKVKQTANIPYDHISVLSVPNRSGVCLHKANFVTQLKGCLAIGDKHVDINGDAIKDITNSGRAFEVLMRMMPDKFKMEIKCTHT